MIYFIIFVLFLKVYYSYIPPIPPPHHSFQLLQIKGRLSEESRKSTRKQQAQQFCKSVQIWVKL